MEKTMTDAKRVTELEKRKRQLEKSTGKGYFVFLIAMLALIFIVDELTSNISSSIQPEVIKVFFVMGQGLDYNIGLSNLALMSLPANIIILILPFYKALADRLGRRLFLFINTIGMGMGMLICMVAPNIYIYIVGLLVIKFFIPNDVQVMYIMESAPEQHRAKLCSMTKTIAYIGVAGIPFLRMGMVCFVMLGAFVFAASQGWNAYLVGACYGIFVGAYWSVSDLLYLVIPGESTPTNLRASVLGTLSLVLIAGGIVSTTIISICMRYVSSLALVCGVVCIPLVLPQPCTCSRYLRYASPKI